jgi:hypothetical protein
MEIRCCVPTFSISDGGQCFNQAVLSTESLASAVHRIASTGADDPRVVADSRFEGPFDFQFAIVTVSVSFGFPVSRTNTCETLLCWRTYPI